ncbi:hypothetical protein niasHT_033794 [Heterodera trifolii]|uniref:PTHB1 N-terminal domain-containing protein n=1 Tax=Heterodera trifolii TaxID=157864 RepID=A0ABD2J7B7_9BILA
MNSLINLADCLTPARSRRSGSANLAELHLTGPVLQLLAGTFLPSTFEENVLAVLLPNSLLFFRLIIPPAGESFACEQVFEHKIGGEPTFNMCSGFFGLSATPLLCVQNVQGILHIFEAENKVLQCPLPDILTSRPNRLFISFRIFVKI